MTRLRNVALLLAAPAAALLCGCGADPYPGEGPGILHTYLVSEMKGFDPAHAAEEIATTCVLNLYDTLYQYQYLKRPFELEPCLAEGMPEVSADERTYLIRIKPGLRYGDDPCFEATDGKGREVTAEDVVFCLARLADARVVSEGAWVVDGIKGLADFHTASKSAPKHRGRYEPIEGLRAVDRHTVEIELEQPMPWFRWILAMPYTSVYAPEAVAYYGEDFQDHVVGTGPYLVKEFQRTQRLVLERNPNYREDLYPSEASPEFAARGYLADAGKRMPLNEGVVATVFRETQPQWLFFQQGFLDRTGIPKDNFDVAVDPVTQDLKGVMAERGIRLEKAPRLEVVYECFHMKDPVLGTPAGEKGRAIRRAISLAYDEAWATKNLYNNRVRNVQGPILEEFDSYDPAFVNPWERAAGETREQALNRARKVLADAGYPGGRGVPTIVYDTQDDTVSRQFFESLRRDLGDIGIDVRQNQVTWQEMQTRIDTGQAQMWGISWGADYPDAQNFLQLFYGPYAPSPNGSEYDNPEFNRLYEEAVRMPPGPARTTLYRRMQQIVVDDAVWVFRFRRINYNLDQPWLANYTYSDISPKYFKYCRVDDAARRASTAAWNRPTWGPVLVVVGGFVLLFLLTATLLRRRTTAW